MEQTVEAVYENGILRPTTLLLDLQEGQRVQLRVRPVVELDPEEYARRHAELMRRLEAEGFLVHFPPPEQPAPVDWKPLVIKGEPMSETVIKMRRGEV